MSKIQKLKYEIEELESQIKDFENHPTETTQFYNALQRDKNRLADKQAELNLLENEVNNEDN